MIPGLDTFTYLMISYMLFKLFPSKEKPEIFTDIFHQRVRLLIQERKPGSGKETRKPEILTIGGKKSLYNKMLRN